MDESARELVARALAEDLGPGDVTSNATVPGDAQGRAQILQKQPGVVFGLQVAGEVFSQAGADQLVEREPEGHWRDAVPACVAEVAGPAAGAAGRRADRRSTCSATCPGWPP